MITILTEMIMISYMDIQYDIIKGRLGNVIGPTKCYKSFLSGLYFRFKNIKIREQIQESYFLGK